MAKYFLYIFAAFLVAIAVSLPTPEEEENHRPGYCKIEDVYIKEGEDAPGPLGLCMEVHCETAASGDGETLGRPCRYIVPRSGCVASEEDYTKRYPDCCPHEVC